MKPSRRVLPGEWSIVSSGQAEIRKLFNYMGSFSITESFFDFGERLLLLTRVWGGKSRVV